MTTTKDFKYVPGTAPDDEPRRFYVDFYSQWGGGGNWYDFTLIDISGEYSPYKGSCELELGLLGLCFTFTYVYDQTFTKKMKAMVDEIKKEI